jgi:hypothetical protein
MDMKTRGCSQEKMGGLGWLLLENEVEDTHTQRREVSIIKSISQLPRRTLFLFSREGGKYAHQKGNFKTDENKINV